MRRDWSHSVPAPHGMTKQPPPRITLDKLGLVMMRVVQLARVDVSLCARVVFVAIMTSTCKAVHYNEHLIIKPVLSVDIVFICSHHQNVNLVDGEKLLARFEVAITFVIVKNL